MATSIYFNGRVTSIPGSYSEVDASGLASVGLGATGIVACIGEVEGSEPAIVQSVSNPGKLSKIFRSGDLLEGGTLLFDPSKDPDIPGGAQEVKFVKVNPATQSTITLEDADGSDSITFTSQDWGAYTEKISVDVSDGTAAGTKAVTISLDSATETFDNVGGDGVATIAYTGTADTATVSFAAASTGLTASVSDALTTSGDYGYSTEFVAGYSGEAEALAQPNGTTDLMSCISSDAADTFDVTIYGKAGGVATTETITLTGTVAAVGATTFTDVYGVHFAASATGTITITGSVSGSSVAVGTNSTALIDFSAAPLEAASPAGAVLTFVADGASTDELIVVGTAGGVTSLEIVALTGTTEVSTSTSWEDVVYVGLGDVANSVNVQVSAAGFSQTSVISLVSSDAADTTQTVNVWGTDGSDAVQSESVLLDGTASQQTSGTYKRGHAVELSAAAVGTVTVSTNAAVRGTAQTAVPLISFELSAGTVSAGISADLDFALNGTTLSWSGATTLTEFIVIGTNAAGAAQSVRYSGASGTSLETWTTIEQVTLSQVPPAVTLTVAYAPFGLTAALYPTFDTWENYFSDQSEWTLTKDMSATSATYTVDLLDDFASEDATGSGYAILDILNDIIDSINSGSALVTAARATDATLPPANTPNAVFLVGGSEGTTTFSEWQAALDTLRDYRVNTIVVLTSDAAVHAAAVSHCVYMCGPGRSERDCVLGMASESTLTEAKAAALALNTRHARLLIQDIQRFNTDGEKERFAPPFTACIAAGMQAGSSVGTSLTFKFLSALDVYGDDSSYTIQDDANELINAGLCMIEKVPNRGWRWLRNVTTYLIDNNLAYTEASVNEAVNYAVYNLRQSLEAIVGQKGFAGTVTAAEGIAVSILGQLVIETVITSYRNLDITLVDDVMTIDVEVAPVIPVNFIKTTIHLVSASFANE